MTSVSVPSLRPLLVTLVLAASCSGQSVDIAPSDAAFDVGTSEPDAQASVDDVPPDVVSPPDAVSLRDVVGLRDAMTLRDAVSPPDVLSAPDVVLPMDVLAPRDVVVPSDTAGCASGATRGCYTGPSETRLVGACRDGTQTCQGGTWTACGGQTLPASAETCDGGNDENCNGVVDEGCPSPLMAPQVTALSIGNMHACVTDEAMQTSCWGGNSRGQLGSIAPVGVTRPTRLPEFDGAQLASNEYYLCLRRRDGSVGCTGGNQYGVLGDGSTTNRSALTTVTAARGATWIAAGLHHVCAVVAGGVRCWGRNEHLQLGTPTTTLCSSDPCATLPVTVPSIEGAVQVVVGRAYSCALIRDSTVRCWGDNTEGQMGIGTRGDGDHGVTTVPGLSGVIQLAGGYDQVCAVMRDGTVRCWGSNSYRNFLELNGPRASPATLPGLAGVVQLAMSIYHACARLNDGSLRCWGQNNFGQVGDGTISSSAALSTPAGLPPVVDVSVGYWLTCARSASRSVWCWGWNLSGGVGDGTSDNTRTTPVRIIP